MSWDEWKQQRAHYLDKNARIAELEAQLAECKENLAYKAEYIADIKHMHVEERRDARKRRLELQAELAHANIESVDLENETQRLRDALPPPDRLRMLAEWFDRNHWSPDTEVQDDLRRWAEAIEQALEKET